MGCGGSKPDSRDDGEGGDDGGEGGEKHKTFRERRLSISQLQDQNTRPRRLSVYGNSEEGPGQPSEVRSPCSTCGCLTLGGFEPVPGGSTAKINQDRGLAIYPWRGEPSMGLFGVYDGHGRAGEHVSEFVLQNLPQCLLEDTDKLDKDPGQALSDAYVKVDEDLARAVDAAVSGTTAVTCLIKDKHLWIANSGDSRAIIVRRVPGSSSLKAIDLTIDHKPDSPAEMKRILQMGGVVTPVSAARPSHPHLHRPPPQRAIAAIHPSARQVHEFARARDPAFLAPPRCLRLPPSVPRDLSTRIHIT